MTPYRKLKDKVARLERDLDIVVNEPYSVSAITITMEWKLKRRTENAIMSGNPTEIEEIKKEDLFDDENPDYIRSSQEEI